MLLISYYCVYTNIKAHKMLFTWRLSCSVKEVRSHMQRACERCSFLVWRHEGWGQPVEPRDPRAHEVSTGSMASWDSQGSGCGCYHIWHRGQRTWLDSGNDNDADVVSQIRSLSHTHLHRRAKHTIYTVSAHLSSFTKQLHLSCFVWLNQCRIWCLHLCSAPSGFLCTCMEKQGILRNVWLTKTDLGVLKCQARRALSSPWKPSCHFPPWILFGFLILSDLSSGSKSSGSKPKKKQIKHQKSKTWVHN